MTNLVRQNATPGNKRQCWKSPLPEDYTSKITLWYTTSFSASSLMHQIHSLMWSHTSRRAMAYLILNHCVAGMKTLPCKSSTVASPNLQLRPSIIETKVQWRSEKKNRNLFQAVSAVEKLGTGIHNADIVEIIWQRVRNVELIQYLTVLKVQFQHQPHNYREVLQAIASQVPSIGVDTLQKACEVLVQGTDSGGDTDQGVKTSTGFYFMAHTLIQNGSVIRSNLTGKISAELATQLIAILVALRPNTGAVPIE